MNCTASIGSLSLAVTFTEVASIGFTSSGSLSQTYANQFTGVSTTGHPNSSEPAC